VPEALLQQPSKRAWRWRFEPEVAPVAMTTTIGGFGRALMTPARHDAGGMRWVARTSSGPILPIVFRASASDAADLIETAPQELAQPIRIWRLPGGKPRYRSAAYGAPEKGELVEYRTRNKEGGSP
jgi:hypothetical protein